MRAVPAKGSTAERKVRALLTGMGLRYRLHRKDLPGSPDIVLAGRGLVIFVHGCFWHGHDCARGARVPKANRDYWLGKVARNRARDARVQGELQVLGWRVAVVWECELKPPDGLAARLAGVVNSA